MISCYSYSLLNLLNFLLNFLLNLLLARASETRHPSEKTEAARPTSRYRKMKTFLDERKMNVEVRKDINEKYEKIGGENANTHLSGCSAEATPNENPKRVN